MRIVSVLLLVGVALAGCSTAPLGPPTEDVPRLDVTSTTGGIRGIVVDPAVVPVAGVTVTLTGSDKSATSGDDGLFNFTGLAPGTYVMNAARPGYVSVQTTTEVVAGVADPPLVKILITRLVSAQPYLDFFKLDGFYECGFAAPVVTDSCDFVWRTGYDGVNQTSGSPPPVIPRSPTAFANTQYIDVPADTFTVIQEGFWDDESVAKMMISLDETPINNECDCSDSYLNVVMANPTYGRLDTFDPKTGKTDEPAGVRAAARGFLPFTDADPNDPSAAAATALNFQFVVLTTLFHNYPAPEGWTFETRDQYPVG